MLGAAFVGMLVFLLSIPSYLKAKTDDRSPFWRLQGRDAERKLARRAARALSRRSFLFGWTLFLPSGLVFVGSILLSLGSGGMGIGIVLGYMAGAGIGFGVAYILGLRKAIAQDLASVAKQAAKALARIGNGDDAQRILGRAAVASQHRFRLAAAIGLRFLGTQDAKTLLKQLTQDKYADVRQAAVSSLENIHAVLEGEGRKSVQPLEQLRDEFQALDDRLEVLVDSGERARLMLKYHSLHDAIEEIIYAQLPLRRAYPALFCMECWSRSEEIVFHDWAWVRCKHCKDVFGLIPGVTACIGQIGGVRSWELNKGVLRLPIWDVEERKARAGEIDLLEIIGGQQLDYDWAVSAAVERLRAYAHTDQYTVEIQWTNPPTLAPNTLKVLQLLVKPDVEYGVPTHPTAPSNQA